MIWSSVIFLETPDCLERDLLLDIVVKRGCQKEIVDKREIERERSGTQALVRESLYQKN